MKICDIKKEAKKIFLPYYMYCLIIILIYHAVSGIASSFGALGILLSTMSGKASSMQIFMTVSLTISLFAAVPLNVGLKRFFLNLTHGEAEMKDILAHFKKGYDRAVGIMFMRILKILLWSVVFVVPGIYKAYEYAMIPYIIAENPTIQTSEAFKASKRLMNGNKMKLFKLQLSFLGWYILAAIPLFAGMFFLSPYTNTATALFYENIKNNKRA